MAVGRENDVLRWVGDTPSEHLTGLASRETFKVSAAGSDEELANAKGSDLWVTSREVGKTQSYEWSKRPGRWSMLLAPLPAENGELSPITGTKIEMTWPQTVTTPYLWPGLALGIVLLVVATVVAVWSIRRRRRLARQEDRRQAREAGRQREAGPEITRRDREVDETSVMAPVKDNQAPELEPGGTAPPVPEPAEEVTTPAAKAEAVKAKEAKAEAAKAKEARAEAAKAKEARAEAAKAEAAKAKEARAERRAARRAEKEAAAASVAAPSPPPSEAEPAAQVPAQTAAELAPAPPPAEPTTRPPAQTATELAPAEPGAPGQAEADLAPTQPGLAGPGPTEGDPAPAEVDQGVADLAEAPAPRAKRRWFGRAKTAKAPPHDESRAPVVEETAEPALDLGRATPSRNWERFAQSEAVRPKAGEAAKPSLVETGPQAPIGPDPVLGPVGARPKPRPLEPLAWPDPPNIRPNLGHTPAEMPRPAAPTASDRAQPTAAQQIEALRAKRDGTGSQAAATIAAAVAAAQGQGTTAGLTRRQIREAEQAAHQALRARPGQNTGELPAVSSQQWVAMQDETGQDGQ